MSLNKRVVEQLEQLVAKGPKQVDAVILNSPKQGYILGVPAEGQEPSVAITVDAYDRFSVMLRQIEVNYSSSSPSHSDAKAYLARSTEQAIRRLTYLEEPLALLELDPKGKLAQLRSQPPHQDGETLAYWELFIWTEPNPGAKLTRYHWQPDAHGRTQVVYPATFATLGRIAQDLALSLTEE